MEVWREELKAAGFDPEVHYQRLPGDIFFCLKINQANGHSVSTVLSDMLQGNHKDRAFLHLFLNLFSSARNTAADALARLWPAIPEAQTLTLALSHTAV